jgi:hypothetical protein
LVAGRHLIALARSPGAQSVRGFFL